MPYGYYYGYGYGADLGYYLVVLASLVLGGLAQAYIKSTYRKWSHVSASIPGTGAEVARRMLDEGGAGNIGITRVSGELTDFFDPRDEKLHLSDANFQGSSVASVAVACHEAGHAVQRKKGFVMYQVRSALAPVVSAAESLWTIVLLAGVFLNAFGLVRAAILLYAATVVFSLVTLPVEIDASRRAVAFLRERGAGLDQRGARQVLVAAALTYVASAMVSVIQLVYLLGRYARRED